MRHRSIEPLKPENIAIDKSVSFMNNQNLLERITFNPKVLAGKPLIRDLRISVATILEVLAKGATTEEILEDYPELEPEDIQAALFYAYQLVDKEEVTARVSV
jgi:uncharacterized protein (DUF433 family)